MALEVPQLGRSLFGYKRSAVDQLIMEREELFVTAARENGELSLQLDDATGEIATLRGRLTELSDEVAADRARSVELEQQLDDLHARVTELDEQRDELERRVAEQTGLVRSSEGRLAVLKAELDSQKGMTVIANERAVRAEATAAERAEQVGDLRSRLDHAETEAYQARSRLELAVSETRIRIDGLAEVFRTALEPMLGSLSALHDRIAEPEGPASASPQQDGDPQIIPLPDDPDEDLAAIATDLLCWQLPQELQHR